MILNFFQRQCEAHSFNETLFGQVCSPPRAPHTLFRNKKPTPEPRFSKFTAFSNKFGGGKYNYTQSLQNSGAGSDV